MRDTTSFRLATRPVPRMYRLASDAAAVIARFPPHRRWRSAKADITTIIKYIQQIASRCCTDCAMTAGMFAPGAPPLGAGWSFTLLLAQLGWLDADVTVRSGSIQSGVWSLARKSSTTAAVPRPGRVRWQDRKDDRVRLDAIDIIGCAPSAALAVLRAPSTRPPWPCRLRQTRRSGESTWWA
jgi:hypothetical protein